MYTYAYKILETISGSTDPEAPRTPFIHSFNNYLVNASYAPSTVPGSENTEVNETNQLATLSDFTF